MTHRDRTGTGEATQDGSVVRGNAEPEPGYSTEQKRCEHRLGSREGDVDSGVRLRAWWAAWHVGGLGHAKYE